MPTGAKLRFHPLKPAFHIVLIEPEIPPNTGAIARTCAATHTPLHLIGPLGFRIDAQAVRRAGLDYWNDVQLSRHNSFDDFLQQHPHRALHLFTSNAPRSYLDANFQPGDVLVFGKESVGLDPELCARFSDRCIAIPTSGSVRSLNLSNAVAIALYEALRQCGAFERTAFEE